MGRRAFRSEWLKNEQGEICALNLGSDYCSEHEHGIERMLQDFKIFKTDYMGIETRTIQDFEIDKLKFTKGKNKSTLSFNNPTEDNIQRKNPEALKCEWSSKDFLITTTTPEDSKNLKELYQAFLDKDIAIWVGSAGIFKNGGLIIAIPSKVNNKDRTTMLEADQDRIELTASAKATGIYEILKTSKKRYWALTPKWIDDSKISQFPVMFWLNPLDTSQNNYGWFTVEELIQWTNNQGAIVKSPECS